MKAQKTTNTVNNIITITEQQPTHSHGLPAVQFKNNITDTTREKKKPTKNTKHKK